MPKPSCRPGHPRTPCRQRLVRRWCARGWLAPCIGPDGAPAYRLTPQGQALFARLRAALDA